ncbi:hypothetical protein SISSUDRAFT_567640 [Sistotremastrum suecicum HHB10207 ss-3]|uniref:Uncharacterized protein n=1 Tax=Sistotremastrum suecicum HHB10207 ss-3 TaxID=1314776 RepID=A0A165XIQ7_9AGAM|nr:hypothetical protein SISSUDRAFT_567640 [Sistotremastrum suecicum HHB10207 ss-3]
MDAFRSSRSTSTHQRLETSTPSTSPPPQEEDLSKATAWVEEEHAPPFPAKWKGKGKQVDDDDDEVDVHSSGDGLDSYPPVDDEAEGRRISENLKRWEEAERRRRKQLRDSTHNQHQPSSVVADVSRKASGLLWSSRNSGHTAASTRPPNLGPKTHQVLSTNDELEGVPLDPINVTHSPSPTPTPTQATQQFDLQIHSQPQDHGLIRRDSLVSAELHVPENPFEDPVIVSRTSSSGSGSSGSAVMVPSSTSSAPPHSNTPPPIRSPSPKTQTTLRESTSSRASNSTTTTAHSSTARPMLPERQTTIGLDGKPVRTGPPRIASPAASSIQQQDLYMDPDPHESRWWTDWLCGCREGPNRGGDDQAGRTNPFE